MLTLAHEQVGEYLPEFEGLNPVTQLYSEFNPEGGGAAYVFLQHLISWYLRETLMLGQEHRIVLQPLQGESKSDVCVLVWRTPPMPHAHMHCRRWRRGSRGRQQGRSLERLSR